jgi:hypothetical protein
MKNPDLGSMEMGDDPIVHVGYPHFEINLPITAGTAYPAGTILQIDGTTKKLEGSDLTSRVYVAYEDISDTDTDALVTALGALRFEKLLHPNGTALTTAEAITVMEKSPLVVI